MRVIRLTHGAGNGVDRACLMTATSMLAGVPEQLDNTSCVCPMLRAFIVKTNDAMPEELLGELYGPLAWEILGTATDDREVMQARAYAFADSAVREIAPMALRDAGLEEAAKRLESLPEIRDKESARAAAADAAHAAADAADADARAAADAAAYAAAYAASQSRLWRKCPDIIRRVASIGDKRPVECVIDCEQLAEALA